MHVLIFEGNTPEKLDENQNFGIDLSASQYGKALQSCDPSVTFDLAEPYAPGFSIKSLEFSKYDGAVFTGSGVSWSTQDNKARPQQQAMEAVFKAQLPTLGSCNGMQLAATVLGGSVQASPNGLELGLALNINLTELGKSHPFHQNRKPVFSCPCIHRDEVRLLPHGAQLTATNDHSQVQALVYEKDGIRFWGTQYHPEYTLGQMTSVLDKPGTLFQAKPDYLEALIEIESGNSTEQNLSLPVDPADLSVSYRTAELRNWLSSLERAEIAA